MKLETVPANQMDPSNSLQLNRKRVGAAVNKRKLLGRVPIET